MTIITGARKAGASWGKISALLQIPAPLPGLLFPALQIIQMAFHRHARDVQESILVEMSEQFSVINQNPMASTRT